MKERILSTEEIQELYKQGYPPDCVVTPNTIEEQERRIIGWMNHSIPRGKTIPIFEDLLETYRLTAYRQGATETIQSVRERAEDALPIKQHEVCDDDNDCPYCNRNLECPYQDVSRAINEVRDNVLRVLKDLEAPVEGEGV